jgi:molecular chaperone DnaJ
LILTLQVRPHKLFHREGDDIHIKAPVTFVEAALGGKITVPTVTGRVSLTIPPGTQSGQKFRLKGQGAPRMGGKGQGDEYVEVYVTAPKKLTKRQKELMEEFAATGWEDPREELDARL